jgi:hypothetical protein
MGNEGSITNMSANEKQKDDLRAYLLSTREFWGLYRTQKENAAWAALILYFGGLAALDGLILQGNASILHWIFAKFWVCLLAVFTACCTGLFIWKQDIDRRYAANISDACNTILVKLVAKHELTGTEWESKPYNDEDCREIRWFPQILIHEIQDSKCRLSPNDWLSSLLPFLRYLAIIIWTVATLLLLPFA